MLNASRLSPHRQPSRRRVLVAGATGFLGLTLADVLRAEAAAGIRSSIKSVINVHLDGGPPQHETIDPKPDAPEEIRGEFTSWVAEKLASGGGGQTYRQMWIPGLTGFVAQSGLFQILFHQSSILFLPP